LSSEIATAIATSASEPRLQTGKVDKAPPGNIDDLLNTQTPIPVKDHLESPAATTNISGAGEDQEPVESEEHSQERLRLWEQERLEQFWTHFPNFRPKQ
jgi:hypothetical protein